MTNLALDTNAYSNLWRGNANLESLVQKADSIGLPIIVLGEIYYGLYNGLLGKQNQTILRRFLSGRVEILHIDESTAQLFGEVSTDLQRKGRPIQQNDIWIAALCKQRGYALATADQGFANVTGLEVIKY